MERSAAYTLRFGALLGVVASAVVATTAVLLASRQEQNRLLDRRRQVLGVAGLLERGEDATRAELTRLFAESATPELVDLETGAVVVGADVAGFDQRAATQDPETSRPAPENPAGVQRLPDRALVYHVRRADDVEVLVLPFEGVGLWSTMYGFIALSADLSAVEGITFYEHGETAGLGARIGDPAWQALWEGRRVFDDDWAPRLRVVKGRAPPPEDAPFEVDGLSGATLTGNGVTRALQLWLGPEAFGPYLARYREERGIS